MAYLKEFEERIEKEDYPGFLRLWEEYCYCDEVDYKEFFQILDKAKNSKLAQSFGHHVEKGLLLWEKIQDRFESKEILKLILDIQVTNTERLYEVALSYISQGGEEDPLFQEKLKLVGLKGPLSFQGSIRNFELLNHLKKGNFVFHKAGWGCSEIIDFSFVREEIALECDLVVGIKHLSFKNAFHTLVPLAKTHFLARRFGDPDNLEKEAKENPVHIIQLLLQDLGPKTAQEIKEELCELVIPEKEWNRWWQNVRAKLKKDTKIHSPKESKGSFFLREQELPHEVLFYKALEKKPSIEDTIQMVYTFLRDFSETLKNQDFKKSLEQKLEEILASTDLKAVHRLQVLFFLEEIKGKKGHKEELYSLLQDLSLVKSMLGEISILSFKKKVLQIVQKQEEKWPSFFLDLLLEVEPNLVRDYIFSELEKKVPELLKERLFVLVKTPSSYPEALVWCFQKVLEGALPFIQKEQEKNPFFEAFLILLAHLNGKEQYKNLAKKMTSTLTGRRYKIVRDFLKNSSLEEAKEYLLLSTKCEWFTDSDLKILHSLAEVEHPSLSKEEVEEDVIWTTEEGYEKAKKRLEHITSSEAVQNAKEIEEARSYGDLRENAEYKAALEKRDRLQSEARFLSELLNQAKILRREDISLEEVQVGSRVICENQKGERVSYTLLGPWDANPEKNILSFQSKFAQAMKGKKRGDSFTFQGDSFVVKEIFSALEQK